MSVSNQHKGKYMKALLIALVLTVSTLALAAYSVQDSQTRYAKILAKYQ